MRRTRRLDSGRRRARGRARRRERLARPACAEPEELAGALRRVLEEPGLRDGLAAAAKPSVAAAVERRGLRQARGAPVAAAPMTRSTSALRRPSAIPPAAFTRAGEEVGRGRAEARLPTSSAPLKVRGRRTDRFRLSAPARPRRLDGMLFHLLLPFRVGAELAQFSARRRGRRRPVRRCGGARGAGAAQRVPVIVEVHGDWRTFTLYGSPFRKARSLRRGRTRAYAC